MTGSIARTTNFPQYPSCIASYPLSPSLYPVSSTFCFTHIHYPSSPSTRSIIHASIRMIHYLRISSAKTPTILLFTRPAPLPHLSLPNPPPTAPYPDSAIPPTAHDSAPAIPRPKHRAAAVPGSESHLASSARHTGPSATAQEDEVVGERRL